MVSSCTENRTLVPVALDLRVYQYIFQDFCFLGCHGQVGVQDFRSYTCIPV